MTDPGNLKAFGTQDKPVILDISQLIRRVQWIVGNEILALEFPIRVAHDPSPIVLTLLGDSFPMFGARIVKHDDKIPVPAVVNPFTGSMLSQLFVWDRAPFKGRVAESNIRDWRAMIFVNITKVKRTIVTKTSKPTEFEFEVHIPIGRTVTRDDSLYWIYADVFAQGFQWNFDHPHTEGDPFSPYPHTDPRSVHTLPRAFSSREERLVYEAVMTPAGFYFTYDQIDVVQLPDAILWRASVGTYRKTKDFTARDFPTNARNEPQWDDSKAVSRASNIGTTTVGTGIVQQPQTLKIKVVFETLAVTITKV